MNNWRLVADSVGYLIPGTHELLLAAIEKEEFKSAVTKQLGKLSYREIPFKDDGISGCKFKIKFEPSREGGEVKTFIKSDQLPEKEEWYLVKNMYGPHIIDILTTENVEHGEIKDAEFEAIFSDSNLGTVSFASTKSELYKECLSELTRRLNFELCKKTRKRIPGHRYDTLDGTYYYLGTYKSHKTGVFNSLYLEDASTEVGLFVKTINPEDKSISDILRTRKCGIDGDDILISYSPGIVSADSGKVLPEESCKIEDFWDNIVENTIKASVKDESGTVKYSDPKLIFDILSIQTEEGKLPKLSEKTISNITEVIKNIMHGMVLKYWGVTTYTIGDNSIVDSNPPEKNINNLVTIFLSRLPDENAKSPEYYRCLFSGAGIGLVGIAESVLNDWNGGAEMVTDFEYYLKNLEYITSRHRPEVIHLMANSCDTKLSEVYAKAPHLVEAIKAVFNSAKDNYGSNVDCYSVTRQGTKRNPIDNTYCSIHVSNLINYFGGIDKLSEDLKSEIMNCGFYCVCIYIDSTKELE